MATTAGFKQECPSCEAMVSVRDESLIGRKIDCPKCKYRFVVEAPEKTEEDSGAEEKKEKKKGKDKPAKGKDKPAADSGNGEAEGKPKKKKGNSSTVMVGAAIGAVAVVVLAFGGIYFLMFSGGSDKPKSSGGGGGGTSANVAKGANPATPGAATTPGSGTSAATAATPAGPATPVAEVTNLLPNDTKTVIALHLDKLLGSSLNKAALLTRGAFNPDDFEVAYGFPLDHVQRFLVALNGPDSIFTVLQLQSDKAIDRAKLQEKLGLATESPVNGLEVFTVKGPFDGLSNLLIKGQQARERMQMRIMDARTLVFADPATMEKFLQEKGKPKLLSQPSSASSGGSGTPAGGAAGTTAPMPAGAPPAGTAPAGKAPAATSPPSTAPAGTAPAGTPAAGATGDSKTKEESSAFYLSIDPGLKSVLDKVDPGDTAPIVAMVGDPRDPLAIEFFRRLRTKLALNPSGEAFDRKLVDRPLVQEIKYAGLALKSFNEEKLTLSTVLDTRAESTAKALDQTLQVLAQTVPGVMRDGLGLEVDAQSGSGGIVVRPADTNPATIRPPMPANPPTGVPTRPGTSGKNGRIHLTQKGRAVIIDFELNYADGAYRRFLHELQALMVELRGGAELAANRSRIHELASVLQAYVADKGHFPRGTVTRQGNERGADFPPTLRQSWLADLLPYLRGDYKELPREGDKTWQEGDNLATAQVLVPQFLSRMPPYVTHYPGINPLLAATHVVGVAGLGLDAAMYPPNNPATAKKAGVFGYDRSTAPKDITDGLDQTIVALQVPSDAASPWLAGGGATIRGISEELDSLEPFVCAEHEGKRGALAIMADGKVRFIPASLPVETFRALCTIAGNDKVSGLDRLCPVIPVPEGEAELNTKGRTKKTEPASTPTTPKKPLGSTTDTTAAVSEQDLEWVEFRDQPGNLIVKIPKGDSKRGPGGSASGIRFTETLFDRPGLKRVYSMRWGNLGAATNSVDPIFDEVRKDLAGGKATLGKATIRVDDCTGQEWVLETADPASEAIVRAFIHKARVYVVYVIGPKGSASDRVTQLFIQSPKLIAR